MSHPLQCKLLYSDAKVPERAYFGDAGYDLFAYFEDGKSTDGSTPEWSTPSPHTKILPPGARLLIGCGVSVSCSSDVAFQIWPRSGMALKHGIDVLGGLVDSGYRGEIKVLLQNHGAFDYPIKHGDKIAQLVPVKLCFTNDLRLHVVETLVDTDRDVNGFGSTSGP